jgi:hypothetical protein
MALGSCRHCGAERIPIDAPLCRECGGWRPNPGFFTQLGVIRTRVTALLLLILGIVLSAVILVVALAGTDCLGALIFLLPSGSLLCGGSSMLLRSLIRPYGQAPSAD